ncbi:MAG TPA: universal stress protein [Microvirga sp.]|jgi:nucleotide-binding universal stress UspA family protein
MFRTILVPVDLAEIDMARPALERAAALAGAEGTVRLVYVRSLLPVTYMEFVPPTFETEQQDEAEEALAAIAASVPLPPERVSATVRLGSVYNEVLQEADATGADLLVVGSHRPTMASYLIGSNASTIVRHARCSVLVVRP